MAYIKSIEINQFRSIKKLSVSGFSNINLIVGDNNSGKTTFLEAIQLLFAKPHLSAIRSIINQRTLLNPDKGFYTSFIKMFNIEEKNNLEFSIHAASNNGPIKYKVKGYKSPKPKLKKESFKKALWELVYTEQKHVIIYQ